MSHTQGTVTYSSTSASTRLSRASLVSLITCARRRLSLKGHTRMSHVTHIFQWDMSLHTCAKFRSSLIKGHIRMSHVKHICEWVVLLHMCARCIFSFEGKGQYWISHVTCISRLSWKGHLQMNRVTSILEWVATHVCEVQIILKRAHRNESRHVVVKTSRTNESCHTHEWIISLNTSAKCQASFKGHIRMGRLAYTNK